MEKILNTLNQRNSRIVIFLCPDGTWLADIKSLCNSYSTFIIRTHEEGLADSGHEGFIDPNMYHFNDELYGVGKNPNEALRDLLNKVAGREIVFYNIAKAKECDRFQIPMSRN